MKYLCSVGQVIEADNQASAEEQFLSMHKTFNREDIDCIEFDIPDMTGMDANGMIDLVEDCLARHEGTCKS